ncbi:hypothetical protein [Pseudomonas japonica]|uniref:hypothetical protein n=1 Tax=Pseudomonas japonica TaxID=256466 RepID=UPI001131BB03|nr:hypothetical protein [Pseudomonas japonica]
MPVVIVENDTSQWEDKTEVVYQDGGSTSTGPPNDQKKTSTDVFFVPATQKIHGLQRFCGLLRVFEFQPFGYSRRYSSSPGTNLWNTESVPEENLMPAQNLRLSDRQLKGVKPASKETVGFRSRSTTSAP